MSPRRASAALVTVVLPFATAPLCAQAEPAPRATADAGIVWHTDLDAARGLAARQDRPLCVVFRCER